MTETTETKHPIDWRPYLTRFILPLLVVVGVLFYFLLPSPEPCDPYPLSVMENRTPFRYRGSFNRDFNDLNDVQMAAALRLGIKPAKTRAEVEKRSALVDISHSKYYKVDDLTHSVPFLVPEAAQLLEGIGKDFYHHLEQDTLPIYLPIVTSVTRTDEDIKDLRRGNINASDNSTHRYATTFDISWKRFHKVDPLDPREISSEELKHLLAQVLREYHKAEKCYIKHERRQACFHITAR